MQQVINLLFSIIISSLVLPIILGLRSLFSYQIKLKKTRKVWDVIISVITLCFVFIALEMIFVQRETETIFCWQNYTVVTIYTVVLAFISSDFAKKYLYQDRNIEVVSKCTAFRMGFTRMSAWMLVAYTPINIIIYALYLGCLIVSQLYEFEIITICSDFVDFCRLHEFGIVILVAIKELLNAIKDKKDKDRNDILNEVLDKDIIGNSVNKVSEKK